MKRFHFPLRPVAVIRAHRELQAREAFGIAMKALREADTALGAALVRVGALEAGIAAGRVRGVRPNEETASALEYRRECAAALEAGRVAAAAREEAAKRREVCIQANRDLKTVNKLEEHARAAFKVESLRADQRELDEIAGFRETRKIRSSS